jgi:SAM-dependent methyltransferase
MSVYESPSIIAKYWNDSQYLEWCDDIFNQVDQYLKTPPLRILDIGCGFARVSELFQKKYGTALYLLDGDSSLTETAIRGGKYGAKESFKFYMPVSDLKTHWDSQNIKYTFVDANDINISDDVKFDLVCSWISCGYHYPANTYRNLIKAHTTSDSVVIMDFRRKLLKDQIDDFNIIHNLTGYNDQKKYRLHISFKDS